MNVPDLICEAIAGRRMISFAYKGSVRTVEPYILGYGEAGELVLSAVQRSGGSGVGFRTFLVEELGPLSMSDKGFPRDHPDYRPGDAFFVRVVCKLEAR
jgi:hypothetical protein